MFVRLLIRFLKVFVALKRAVNHRTTNVFLVRSSELSSFTISSRFSWVIERLGCSGGRHLARL